jgi:hypothetical protein
MADRKKAELVMRHGEDVMVSEIYFLREFVAILSAPRVTISSFIEEDPLYRKVQASGFVGERFNILIDFEVKFSFSSHLSIISYSQPKISVHRISDISRLEDGRYRLKFSGSRRIDEARVKDLVSGRLMVEELLRECIKDEHGVVGFREYIEWYERRD